LVEDACATTDELLLSLSALLPVALDDEVGGMTDELDFSSSFLMLVDDEALASAIDPRRP
jgi:hypothetical protein